MVIHCCTVAGADGHGKVGYKLADFAVATACGQQQGCCRCENQKRIFFML